MSLSRNKTPQPLLLASPLHKAMRQMTLYLDAAVRPLGLQGPDGHLLSYVGSYGPCKTSELRKVFGHKPSTLTSLLDRLEGKGWVERSIDPGDRRGFLITATEAGMEVGVRGREVVEEFERRVLERIGGDQLAGFTSVLTAIGEETQVELRRSTD